MSLAKYGEAEVRKLLGDMGYKPEVIAEAVRLLA